MRFVADLHIHSHYSLATSKELVPEFLDLWARIKGIGVVATGDFTHPKWIAELKEKLIPTGTGLFKLKPELRYKLPFQNPDIENKDVHFVLSSEISSIYKKNGKVRKVHNLLYAPDFDTVEKLQFKLGKIGNITSDGRPILGLDSRDLLEIALQVNPQIFFVPAHIWTPWFSVLGEKGGFNSIDECFEDLTPYIFALETGLSTNPALNWMCSFLDNFTLLSNSDAHSPDRLGRNANILNCDLSYSTLFESIKKADGESFIGTIDMFPQEGKYHYDGHRKCNVCWDPVETLRNRAICPVCGRRVVIGVASRIAQISDRTDITQRPNRRDFFSIIPLPEILSEITGAGESSKKVKQLYFQLLQKCGNEFDILLNHPIEFIEKNCGPAVGEAIQRMRNGQVFIKEGYDGEYGIIKVFQPGEQKLYEAGEKLFDTKISPPANRPLLNFDLKEYQQLVNDNFSIEDEEEPENKENADWLSSFNAEQKKAVMHTYGPALVLAGPGTGKTRVLTSRIMYLTKNLNINPSQILAITFTNKAAGEIRERLNSYDLSTENINLTVTTFHSLGLEIINNHIEAFHRNSSFFLVGDEEKIAVLKKISGKSERECKKIAFEIEKAKQNLLIESGIADLEIARIFVNYQRYLKENSAFDLEDLIYETYHTFKTHPEILQSYQLQYQWILIDEFQDINFSQYQLIKLLAGEGNKNIFAIGDPNQAIYSFRGSNVSYIRQFTVDFKNALEYKLKRSYRCTDRILQAATQVLNIITTDEPLDGTSRGLKLRIDTHLDDISEALFIAKRIDAHMGGMQFYSMDKGLSPTDEPDINELSDIAVLCRTKHQMKIIEKIFIEKNIPFQTIGNEGIYRIEPYKTILDLLNYLNNPENQIFKDLLSDKGILYPKLDGTTNTAINISEKINLIVDTFPEIKSKIDEYTFQQFKKLAENCGNRLPEFINTCLTGVGIDSWQQKAQRVSIMTIHASKGLEFDCVFIPGCEEGIIPYTLYKDNTDINEEIRLLYVGMTRASKYLYLSHATRRTLNNRELRLNRSPFLDQIANSLFELSQKDKKKEKQVDNQLKLF